MTRDNLFSLIDSQINIQWQTEKCDKDSILFYKFNKKTKDEKDAFIARTKGINFKACVINIEDEFDECLCVSDEEFSHLQEDLLTRLYPHKDSLFFVGVTGTNGKTTTIDLVRQLCVLNEKNILTFGTLGSYKNDEFVENFHLTTPNLIDAHKLIWEHQKELDVVAFELSSHALEQDRLGHLRFDSLGWTNFTQDHLDFHKDMESYFMAKSKISELKKSDGSIFLTRSLKDYFKKIKFEHKVTKEKEQAEHQFFKLDFNKSNLNMAITLLRNIFPKLSNFPTKLGPAPGRFEVKAIGKSFVAIDYAHTPDALRSICREVKNQFPSHKLKVLFGCGGDRDKEKRALMGKAASSYADYVFVTSDNPRFEKPSDIINDIVAGLSVKYEREIEREQAINNALATLDKEILIIAGKGHENYIDIKGVKIPYSDKDVVDKYIASRSND